MKIEIFFLKKKLVIEKNLTIANRTLQAMAGNF